MPTERLPMRKIKEIFRLHFEQKLSNRQVAASTAVSASTVSDCLLRAETAKIQWPLPEDLDESTLEAMLYPPQASSNQPRASIDSEGIHKELARKGVTLRLLWQEYKEAHPDDGYQYSQYCDIYRDYRKGLDVVMRQPHLAGEKMFVDFSGDGIPITNPLSGEAREAQLFVAVLGASSYSFSQAYETQDERDWIAGHIHAFEYFHGVTQIVVPDNPRTGVVKPCLYDPVLNRSYRDMAEYYDTAIIPARVRKPKDKAKVENGVLIAQRWILAALRNHTFFSLPQANEAIRKKLVEWNLRKFQKMDTNRRELFEKLDRPALKPLPAKRYEYASWFSPRVNVDYHVEVDKHYYSVPYALIHQKVEVRQNASTVEVFFKGQRVASHCRSSIAHGHTTLPEHMPEAHRKHLEWTPERILKWAEKTGPNTVLLVQRVIESKRHPQQGFRACLGILRLGDKYGQDRLEEACLRALVAQAITYRSVESILKNNLDRRPPVEPPACPPADPIQHENLRGPQYYN